MNSLLIPDPTNTVASVATRHSGAAKQEFIQKYRIVFEDIIFLLLKVILRKMCARAQSGKTVLLKEFLLAQTRHGSFFRFFFVDTKRNNSPNL
jgi:hypothetical protein